MDVRVDSGAATALKADALIVGLFFGQTELSGALADLDKALDGAISELLANKEFKGARYEAEMVLTMGKLAARRVVLAGLGKEDQYSSYYMRTCAAAAARSARKKGATTLAIHFPTAPDTHAQEMAQALTEGVVMGLVDPDIYKSDNEDKVTVTALTILSGAGDSAAASEGVRRGNIMAEASNLTRSLAEEPANVMNPVRLAAEARKVAEQYGLEIEVLGRAEMEERGMGSILGVALGSVTEPQLIALKYMKGGAGAETVALVGKGITFDTGGTSIKPAENMHYMKYDMCGAAAVLGAIKAIAEFGPAANVIGVMCCVENMPGGAAQRPGDVVRASNGKTIEVLNTDAEGRLVLADGIVWAQKLGAKHVVDICTLTGAAVITLGHAATCLLGSPQVWVDQVKRASDESGERVWQLPIFPEYREQLKSNIADLANIGGRPAGTITAAVFIQQFVEDGNSWAHLDIAATAYSERDLPYLPQGSSGAGVRTMTNLILDLANGK